MQNNFESPIGRKAFDAVRSQRPLAEKLFAALIELSCDSEGGVTRAPYSPEETNVHQRFGKIAQNLGLTVTRDALANTYMTLPGSDPAAKKILIGFDLDSVKQGGNLGGAA